MANHTYKIDEYVGSSPEGQDAAIRNAIECAARSTSRLRWFEVKETRGQVVDGKVSHWQVVLRVGSTVE